MNVFRSCSRVARPCRQMVRRMSDKIALFDQKFDQKFEKSLNKIAIIGKLQNTPELENERAVFYIAADGKNSISIRVEAVNQFSVKFVSENLKKGDTLFVDGRLEYMIERGDDNEVIEKRPVIKSVRINSLDIGESIQSEEIEEAV